MSTHTRESDKEFYSKRAADERARAEACRDPQIAAIHRELADKYEQLVGLSGDKARLHLVAD